MNLVKKIILLTLAISLNSCKNNSFKSETETYKMEIKKAGYFHSDFTNHIQKTPLNINAEKITLKEIFSILIKSDTSNIKFEDEILQNEYYSLVIEQKDKEISINEMVLNKLLNELNLKLVENKYKSYNIIIEDSLKYSRYISKSKNKVSSVFISKDSVKLSNCDLNKLTEILNSEFSEKTICNINSKRVDYNWKKSSFGKLKLQLKNDLGLNFLDTRNDKLIYSIKND